MEPTRSSDQNVGFVLLAAALHPETCGSKGIYASQDAGVRKSEAGVEFQRLLRF